MTKHTITRRALAALGLLAVVGVAAPAGAAIYEAQAIATVRTASSPFNPSPASFNLSFEVSDAAVTRGMFSVRSLFGNDSGQPAAFAGDTADFGFLQVVGDRVTPTRLRGQVEDFTVSFGAQGIVTGFRLSYGGDVAEANLSGAGTNWIDGSFGSDPSCSDQRSSELYCTVSARLVATTGPNVGAGATTAAPVPEPMSLVLLSAGLMGLAVARRRD